MTETALAELLGAPLGHLDLVALMIDGVHFGEHLCVVAVTKKMRAAYHAPSAIIAQAQLEALARELEHTHPGA